MDVTTATQWTAFVVAIITILAGLVRLWTKVKNANGNDTTVTDINNKLLINLKEEIARLEKIIAKLNSRIGTLESNINSLRNLEIQSASDFGSLETVIATMPCTTCSNQGEGFIQLTDVVDRMRLRRAERHLLISEAGRTVDCNTQP